MSHFEIHVYTDTAPAGLRFWSDRGTWESDPMKGTMPFLTHQNAQYMANILTNIGIPDYITGVPFIVTFGCDGHEVDEVAVPHPESVHPETYMPRMDA